MDLDLRPLASGFGAVVEHDLSHALTPHADRDPDLARTLAAALHGYRLLILPDQHLNHADLLAATRLFGTVDTDVDRRYAVDGFPGITVVSNILEHGERVGIYDGDHEEEWHSDNSFKPQLTSTTLLYSVITPAHGGETRFADATRAYADLPSELKARLRDLRAVHSIEQLGIRQAQVAAGRSSAAAGTLADRAEVEHPLAPIHPTTGVRSLLIGSMVVKGVVGQPDHESADLLDTLLTHATSPPYVHTHQWSQGDLVIWDNQALLHTASPCNSSRNRRLLFRSSVR